MYTEIWIRVYITHTAFIKIYIFHYFHYIRHHFNSVHCDACKSVNQITLGYPDVTTTHSKCKLCACLMCISTLRATFDC